MNSSNHEKDMPRTPDGKPDQDSIDAFEMRRSGMSWRMVSAAFAKRGKEIPPHRAEAISYQYLNWARDEARRKEEESKDFRVFSVFNIDWFGRAVSCSLPHVRGADFSNPVYVDTGKRGEVNDSGILEIINAMREHGRKYHGL